MIPENFLWGASESGFQFEMGDRLRRFIDPNSDWWCWVRDPKNISNKIVSGDLPEDGINYAELYKNDHVIAKELGLISYRIGIEWSRIFPCSTHHVEVDVERDGLGLIKEVKINSEVLQRLDGLANKEAVSFYRELINDLRKKGLKVIVNLSHFTLPIWIHHPIMARDTNLEKGAKGFVDENFVIEFTKYAAYIAWKLGDIVDMWSTFNEPLVPVELGYLMPFVGHPPGVHNPKGAKLALINLVVAHARAFDAIKKWDRVRADKESSSPSAIGVIHNIIPAYPLSEQDMEGAESYNYFHNTLILDAWTRGVFDLELDGKSASRQAHLSNKIEWIGLNYYTRIVVKKSKPKYEELSAIKFEGVEGYGYACSPSGVSKDGRPCDESGWELYPEGLLRSLEIVKEYGLPIYITENGAADIEDRYRPLYITSHIASVEKALSEGINVKGYFHWALTDNYEWSEGFRMKFGLYEVDLITKARKPRKSAYIFKKIIANKGLTEDLKETYLTSYGLNKIL